MTQPESGLTVPFKQRVRNLVAQQREIVDAQIDVQTRLLTFCRDFVQTEQEAERLGAVASEFLYKETTLSGASVQSLYRRIGEQFAALNRHRKSLPSSVEGLALLARAEESKPGSVKSLVAKGKIDQDTTVSELRKLATKRPRRHASQEATTECRFVLLGTNRKEVMNAVLGLLRNTAGVRCLVADPSLFNAGKAELGTWWRKNPLRFERE